MIFEHRQYEVAAGRMNELIDRFKKHTVRLFFKHGIEPVLFHVLDSEENYIFFYIVRFESREDMKKRWKSFLDDEERKAIWERSNSNGKLVLKIESRVFRPVSI